MRVGIPTEIKNNEYRVAITPAGVAELVHRGHEVLIQAGAGEGSAISDADFKRAGAQMINSVDEVWAEADLLLKVKEPIEPEYARLREGQTLFTYLHLAASRPCTDALMTSGTTSIAYETVQTADGALPLLAPMSEVAGRLAAQVGAYHLMRTHGGRGVLMGGVPGVAPANVVVIGGGMAGDNAAAVAKGMGARVTVFDLNINTLRKIDAEYGGSIETRYSSRLDLEDAVKEADLVIGAVLVPGAKAPKLVTNSTVAHMKAGAVLVDIAIDQGGCFEDSRPTTHDDPTFAVHDTVFYCVANMPGAVPRTSTYALTNATMPYVVKLAERAGRPRATPIPLLRRVFRPMRVRCCPSRWHPIWNCPSPIRPPFWPDRSTEQLPVHVKPTTGSSGEVGPLMQRPTSSVSAIVGPKLHLAFLVTTLSRHRVEDLQSRPRLIGRRHRLGPGARMPRPPDIVQVPHRVRAVPRSHQLLGGRRGALPSVKRPAAPAEHLFTAAGTVICRGHG